MEIALKNQNFSVDALYASTSKVPLISIDQSHQTNVPSESCAAHCLDIVLHLGNAYHIESDLPKDEIDDTDLNLKLIMQPIEVIF